MIKFEKVRFSIARVTSTDYSTLITGLKLIDKGDAIYGLVMLGLRPVIRSII